MSVKVYVSSHSVEKAIELIGHLEKSRGIEVASTWHTRFSPSEGLTVEEKEKIAFSNIEEIEEADALVLIASDDKVPGGKFVEAGYALGFHLGVFVLGRRENIILHHPFIEQADTVDELIELIKKIKPFLPPQLPPVKRPIYPPVPMG